jgi:hypothetical protein
MKNKLLLTAVLFLIIGSKSFAQIDTLKVYLEKNPKYKYGVDLVFENNSNDTIFLFTRFHNLSLGGEIPRYVGICINFFSNNHEFTFNWGELPPLMFIFSKGRTLINPKSKVKLCFNVGEYFKFPEKSSEKCEVSFLINYSFAKYLQPETAVNIIYFETNRITMVEPTEDTEPTDLL